MDRHARPPAKRSPFRQASLGRIRRQLFTLLWVDQSHAPFPVFGLQLTLCRRLNVVDDSLCNGLISIGRFDTHVSLRWTKTSTRHRHEFDQHSLVPWSAVDLCQPQPVPRRSSVLLPQLSKGTRHNMPNFTVPDDGQWNSKPAWKLPGWCEPVVRYVRTLECGDTVH